MGRKICANLWQGAGIRNTTFVTVLFLCACAPSYAAGAHVGERCPPLHQKWHGANQDVCLPNQMVNYLACLEVSGKGVWKYVEDKSTASSGRKGVAVEGGGHGVVIGVMGKVAVDTRKADTAISRIKQVYDPDNASRCYMLSVLEPSSGQAKDARVKSPSRRSKPGPSRTSKATGGVQKGTERRSGEDESKLPPKRPIPVNTDRPDPSPPAITGTLPRLSLTLSKTFYDNPYSLDLTETTPPLKLFPKEQVKIKLRGFAAITPSSIKWTCSPASWCDLKPSTDSSEVTFDAPHDSGGGYLLILEISSMAQSRMYQVPLVVQN